MGSDHSALILLAAFRCPKQARSELGGQELPSADTKRLAPSSGPQAEPSLTGLSFLSQVFHCVHFECPEQQSSQKEDTSEEPGTGDLNTPAQQLDPHTPRAPSASSLPPSPGPNSRSPNQQNQ